MIDIWMQIFIGNRKMMIWSKILESLRNEAEWFWHAERHCATEELETNVFYRNSTSLSGGNLFYGVPPA